MAAMLKKWLRWETKRERELTEDLRNLKTAYVYHFNDVLTLTKDLVECKATLLNVEIENSRVKRENERLNKILFSCLEKGGAK